MTSRVPACRRLGGCLCAVLRLDDGPIWARAHGCPTPIPEGMGSVRVPRTELDELAAGAALPPVPHQQTAENVAEMFDRVIAEAIDSSKALFSPPPPDDRPLMEKIKEMYDRLDPPVLTPRSANLFDQFMAEIDNEHLREMNRLSMSAAGRLARQRDDALASLPEGYRLCMHEVRADSRFDADTTTIRFRQDSHILASGEVCGHRGSRTEYSGTAIDEAVRDQRQSASRLDALIKAYSTFEGGRRPGDVFLEVGPDAWASIKARTPKPQQIAAGSVPIWDLTGVRVLLDEERGHGWRLLDTRTGDVVEEGTEP